MKRKGFTLVEVLIVVIIIGILASIGIPQFAKSIEKAKGGEARAGLGHIQTAEKIYQAEEERWSYFNQTTADYIEPTDLDISLTQKYWYFKVETTLGGAGYLATATRKPAGPHQGQTLTMDHKGSIGGNWDFK